MRVEQVDTRVAPEDLLLAMHEYYIVLSEEELPGDPPMPAERRLADWRNLRDEEDLPRWVLWDDDQIVGVALAWLDLEHNLEKGFARVHIRADRRGEGLARVLSKPVFDYLEERGRQTVHTYVLEGSSEAELCKRLGLKPAYREKRSRLVVDEIDRDLMRRWVDRAPERAADYHLISLKTPFPEEHVDKYADLMYQMNTAPLEDLEWDDEVMTPDNWRSMEKMLDGSDKQLLTLVAVHTPSGEYVGSTSVQIDRLDPAQAWQWETVVHPDHRNKGLGRWLKGANALRVLDEHPVVERIDTENAGSNEPMLNINVAMGFKPIQITNAWQGDTAEARRRLGV